VSDQADGYIAFFVKDEGGVGTYDIYNEKYEWVAQCRFNRRKGSDIYVLFLRDRIIPTPLAELHGRDAWRKWLTAHVSTF
jgi:hypothetical protein